jgi:hypothetical protein
LMVNFPLLLMKIRRGEKEGINFRQNHLWWLNSLICSTSALFPADRIILFSSQPSTFLKVQYLNLSSLNP